MTTMLTDAQIDEAMASYRTQTDYHGTLRHEQIRVCYEWLDAQKKTAKIVVSARAFKHILRQWAGCQLVWEEFVVAALLHPDVKGRNYPNFNISRRLICPRIERVAHLACVGEIHPPLERIHAEDYDGGHEGDT